MDVHAAAPSLLISIKMDVHAAAPSLLISINMDVHAAAPSLLISINMDVHAAAPSLLISIKMASPSDVSQCSVLPVEFFYYSRKVYSNIATPIMLWYSI